jgi:quinol monooxygenase YgiN
MMIAIVDFRVAATDRPTALAHLDRERDEVRAMPGNLGFRVYASREDDTSITILHEWQDVASFGGYSGSEAFARSGAVLRPMMIDPPVSRRFHADLLEAVR